tara:strand:+ start:490 stop:921 length:432 start_codon:yes stop_codon:yes gene_type:complete
MTAFLTEKKYQKNTSYKPMSEINVTPFVDVMLVLLVIFMVTAPLLTVGVSVDLPKTKAKVIPGKDEPLAISIDSIGNIFIQDTQVELNTLTARLKAISNNRKDSRIFIRGDRKIDYGKVMEVMSEITAAGYNKVSLITEKPQP